MRPLTSTISLTSPLRLMCRMVWRGKVFFYWLTLGLRKCDLYRREERSISGANLSYNNGQLPGPQNSIPQGQNLDRIDNSRLVYGGRSHLSTAHAISIKESTMREDAFSDFMNQGSSTTLPEDVSSSKMRRCACFGCLNLFRTSENKEAVSLARRDGEDIHCRIPGCDWKITGRNSFTYDYHSRSDHEKRHFMEPRLDLSLACTQDHCNFITKRQPDLRRHYRSMHCLNPDTFSCPVLWCKYSGLNGFTRKDKLTSHYRNVHEGKTGRGQPLQRIQPALPAAFASEGRVSVSI